MSERDLHGSEDRRSQEECEKSSQLLTHFSKRASSEQCKEGDYDAWNGPPATHGSWRHDEYVRESGLDLGTTARWNLPRAVDCGPGEQHWHLDAECWGPVAVGQPAARLTPGRAGPDG